MQDTEKFYPLKGFEGYYEITKSGIVRSLDRFVPGRGGVAICPVKGRTLKFETTNKGYYRVSLSISGVKRRYSLHRILAINFIPNPNNLPFINHKNGIRKDNSLDNLEWCDSSHNNRDRFTRPNIHVRRKLSHEDVIYIRKFGKKGRNGNVKMLCDKFDCSTTLILNCLRRDTYKNPELIINN